MNSLKATNFAVVIIAIIAASLVYPLLPSTVPTHWNAFGEADGSGPAWVGAFLIPLVMASMLLLFVVIPKIEPFKENLKECEKQYWLLGFVLQLFFLSIYALTLFPNFGYKFNFALPFTVLFALLFIVLGLLMPSFKRNFFVGIRTPWSLANDAVWRKTHIFGGKAFIAAGVAALLSLPFPGLSFFVAIGAIIAAAAASIIYSFLEFKKSGKVKL